MTRYEMNAISCNFANNLWTNPRSGEDRLYINGVAGGAKVWLTEGEDGRPVVHWKKGWEFFTVDDAYESFGVALDSVKLYGDVKFKDIVNTITNPDPATVSTEKMASRAMKLAHHIRRESAERFGCRISEIHWGECLRMAWAEVKAGN